MDNTAEDDATQSDLDAIMPDDQSASIETSSEAGEGSWMQAVLLTSF